MTFRPLLPLSVAALTALAAGCAVEPPTDGDLTATDAPAATPAAASEPVNETCPLMGGDVDPAVTTEWNGQTVGFCCAKCIPEWKELTEEEKAEKLAAAQAGETENEMHMDHGDHDHGDA
ncbi:hypothetical protein [Alienimonas sp. DA493]|uniref:hypothetical protein n=1 Tax=Alienimonas sp. DA493 TaxID=3373605 RepID=UPI003754B611